MTPAVFSHGDLRLYLLALLDESPRHGYGIIQALAERTGGTYTPSAGTVYPRLAKLEEDGLVTKTVDGRTSVYAITAAGRAELDARRDDLDGIESGLTDSVRLIAAEVRQSVHDAMRSLRADLAAARDDGSATTGSPRAASGDHVHSRELLARAETALHSFRARTRSDLRRHVARGGTLDAALVTELEAQLDAVATAITRATAD